MDTENEQIEPEDWDLLDSFGGIDTDPVVLYFPNDDWEKDGHLFEGLLDE